MKKFFLLFFTILVLLTLPSKIHAECVEPGGILEPCGGDYPDETCTDNDGKRWCCDLPGECTTPITEAPGPPADIENVELPKYSDLEGFIGQFRWGDDATLGDIISSLLPLIFVLAGIGFFVYLLFGGFTLLTSAGNPKNIQKGQKMITNGLIGFLIVLTSYWIAQILQSILNIGILGGSGT